MAAGQGFKTFANGDILTAADVNGYLMQNVWVFASTAARDAAVTAPQQGNMAYTKDTDTIWKYTGSTWTNIDTTGSSPLTTKGDLYGYSTTNARVPIGTNGQVLTADSTQALGLKWAAVPASAPASASLYTATTETTTSTSFTNLTTVDSVTLTTGTKALVIIKASGYMSTPAASTQMMMSYAVSGATTIAASNPQAGLFPLLPSSANQCTYTTVHFVNTLTAGSNTFTTKYAVASGTVSFLQRQITVIDMGS